MQVIDPQKLVEYRELVDEAIARLTIEGNRSRDFAYFDLGMDEFQTGLELRGSQSGWCTSCVIENHGSYCFQGPWERVANGSMEGHDAALWVLSSTLVARDPETLLIGAILRLLDEDVDLGMSFEVFRTYYGIAAIPDVVNAVACRCHRHQDLSQGWLFERTFDERLSEANRVILRELRPQVDAWARYYCGQTTYDLALNDSDV